MFLHGSSAKSHVHAQPMEISIRTAIWGVLSSCPPTESLKITNSPLFWPSADTQLIMALQAATEPIFTLLPFLHSHNCCDNITPADKWWKIAPDEMSCKMLKPKGKGREIHPRIFWHARAEIHLSNYCRAHKASLTFKHQRITELQYLINLHFFFYD